MASAWGSSWGAAWGNSWGSVGPTPAVKAKIVVVPPRSNREIAEARPNISRVKRVR